MVMYQTKNGFVTQGQAEAIGDPSRFVTTAACQFLHRHPSWVYLSRLSCQFGRTSAPMMPRRGRDNVDRGNCILTGLQGRMTKRSTTTQESHNWAVYLTKTIPAKLVGFIEDSPDERTAIARAITEYRVPKDEQGRLVARRRN